MPSTPITCVRPTRRDLLIGVSSGSALFLNERPTPRQVVGIAIAIAMLGAVVIGYGDARGTTATPNALAGDLLALVVVLLLATTTGAPLWPQPAREMWIFAGIALGPMMLGHTGFNWSLRYVPADVVSLAILVEPVGATLLAALLPGIAESPSAATLLGGAVILGGLVVDTLRPQGQ